ncbi:acyltransferase [Lampropedia puyangensis]|uniref:Acyltransferase n=1 Tax=Lampropedia puyangensis TaxID=1330072 RepID=A0A4S8F8Y0_9BURK|nr:acyltransferase family protein [Lampropedia puyangensis]THU03707.1 acyltransferase [Lampropedia puyangensis]
MSKLAFRKLLNPTLTGSHCMTIQRTSPFFRPDIEGLRAVALLLVIGAHFSIPGFGAGFIGVDVFFVISGYLITGVLVREYENTGRIAVKRFYANRLRRLLPALIVMLIVSSLLGLWLLSPPQNLVQSESAAMAAIWASNIYFAFADSDYFGMEASGNVFLHTWSLGVEEQFYLLWPLCIFAAFRWIGRRGKKSALAWLLGAIGVLSLGVCLALANTEPLLAFYMMPSRAWQFSAGALVWLLFRQHLPTPGIAGITAWVGAWLLVAGLVVIDSRSTIYPGMLALLPTLGACALLWAGTARGLHAASPTRLLASPSRWLCLPPMQRIGNISYAWYLWHWPVLVIGENLLPIKGDAGNTLLAIAVSLVAAMATHWLVENPIRYGRPARVTPEWQIGLALFAMLALQVVLYRWHMSIQSQLVDSNDNVYVSAVSDLPVIYQHGCDDWYSSADLKLCEYGEENAAKTAVLLGDSIGAQWFPTLAAMLDTRQWKIIVLTKSSCPIVDEPFFYERIGREFTECEAWRNKAITWLQHRHIDRLFIGSTASYAFTDQQWVEGTHRVLARLTPHARAVYLLEANPTLGVHGPQCLMQNSDKESQACSSSTNSPRYTHVASLLKGTTSVYTNVHWLETSSVVCPAGQCDAIRDGVIVFRDAQHLTASFTARATPHFLQQIRHHEQAATTDLRDAENTSR